MTDASPWDSRPVADQTIDRRVAEYLRRKGLPPLTTIVTRLHGDASNRCYVRVTRRDGPSIVLAVHPEPFATDTLPEIAVGALFEQLAIPVPAVIGQAGDLGILALEDLGDQTLQDWLTVPEGDPACLYREAVGLIAKLQRDGAGTARRRVASLYPSARHHQADLGAGVLPVGVSARVSERHARPRGNRGLSAGDLDDRRRTGGRAASALPPGLPQPQPHGASESAGRDRFTGRTYGTSHV